MIYHQSIKQELLQNNTNTRPQSIKNSPTIKIQSKMQSPTKKLQDKENEMLKMKGTDIANNRKSTKKLKLFSLIWIDLTDY